MPNYLFILSITLLLLSGSRVDARTWTDQRGRTIDADLIALKDGVATLKKADGQLVSVKVSTLSLGDRKFISDHPPPAEREVEKIEKNASGKFGFETLRLSESASNHPSDASQKIQDLVITFSDGKRTANEYTLKIAFVSGSPDGAVSPLAFRAPPAKAGFSNGSASYPLAKNQLNITELKVPLPRYSSLVFIGYEVQLLDGDTIIDKKYWENTDLLETIARKLQIDKDWWLKDAAN